MIEALKELGEFVIKGEKLDEAAKFVKKGKLTDTKRVICIVFLRSKKGKLAYEKTHLEDYDREKAFKYLYRYGPSSGVDATPTSRITQIDKTFERIFNWFEEHREDDHLILSLREEMRTEKEKIRGDVVNEFQRLPKEEKNSIITIKVRENGEEKYIGEFESFRRILINEGKRGFVHRKTFGESKGMGTCCICKKEDEVYGYAFPFSFYTVDKQGFASQFVQCNSWKQLPICLNCACSLDVGKDFLDDYLSFSFYGYKYYVIPKFFFGEVAGKLIDLIKDFKGKEYMEGLLSEENFMFETVEKEKDILSLIFLFYRQKGGGKYLDVVQFVEGVPPSWIKKLVGGFKKTLKDDVFKEEALNRILGKKWVGDLSNQKKGITIGSLVKTFFPSKSEEAGSCDRHFLDIVGNILSAEPIDKGLLIKSFMREIRTSYRRKKEWEARMKTLKSFLLFKYLYALGLTH
jgi:CRISPR-associated protein Csh1